MDAEDTSRNLAPLVWGEVYRIAGEALRNAFRHSQTGRIIDAGGRSGHHGLPGMRERANMVGGKLVVRSPLHSGTEVEMTILASLAYAKPRSHAGGCSGKIEPDNSMRDGSNAIRILSVDDHPLFRNGIAALLATQPDMSLVAEASNGRQAIQQFRVHRPDITLMDLQMPEMNGLDAMIAIRGEFPEARIIVLTTYSGDVQVLRALKVGARAYLLKSLLDRELLETIRAVHAGKKTLSAEAAFELAEHATDEALTQGEADVLRLIAAGNANKQIAAQLSVTEETVKGRVKNILSKLGANDRTHAAMIGIKRGIIDS